MKPTPYPNSSSFDVAMSPAYVLSSAACGSTDSGPRPSSNDRNLLRSSIVVKMLPFRTRYRRPPLSSRVDAVGQPVHLPVSRSRSQGHSRSRCSLQTACDACRGDQAHACYVASAHREPRSRGAVVPCQSEHGGTAHHHAITQNRQSLKSDTSAPAIPPATPEACLRSPAPSPSPP